MRIDAHQHFWKYNSSEFSWISEQMKALRRDFLPGDLLPEIRGIEFDGALAVQARQSLEETRWLLELAGRHDFIKGVIGWIDLCSEQTEGQIREFIRIPKLVGVRHVLQDEPDDLFMLKESFLRGIDLLGKYNLAYDILIYPKHIFFAEELVTKYPGQKFILDHIAKPDIKHRLISPWKEGIQNLAKHQNVFCKLSGMVTEASWDVWRKADFKPYLDIVTEAFGPSRLMIGSDWPVCTISSGYKMTMEIVIDYIQSLNQDERDMILGRNAIRIYNLQIKEKQ